MSQHIISTAVFSKDHEYNGKKTKELSGSLCPLIDSLAGNLLQQHMMELETPSPEWLCKLEQECKSDYYIITFNPDGVEEDKRAIYEGCYDTAVEMTVLYRD